MSDYSSEIASAQKDIKAAGRAVTFRKNADTDDLDTGGVVQVPTDVTAYVVQTAKSYFKGDDNYGLITKAFLMSTENVTTSPVQGDEIIEGSSTYSIEIVDSVAPNGDDIIYKVACHG